MASLSMYKKVSNAEESAISILGGWSLLNYAAYKPHPHHEIMKEQLTSFETSGAGTHHTPGLNPGTQATFLLSPITARDLKNEGFDSKEQLGRWIKENAYMTVWTYWAAMPDDLESARAGVEPFASWLKLPPEATSPRPLILEKCHGRDHGSWRRNRRILDGRRLQLHGVCIGGRVAMTIVRTSVRPG